MFRFPVSLLLALSLVAFAAAAALMLSLVAAPAAQAQAASTVAYVNGRWWDGHRFVKGARYVRDGVFAPKPSGRPDRTEDLKAGFVVPPFADAHNHMPGRAQDVSARATAAGVFYLMNPTILASAAPALREALKGPGKVEAVLSMGAVTAPGGHPEKLYVEILRPRVYPNIKPQDFLGDAFHYVTKPADIGPLLDKLQAQGAQFVKIMVLYSAEYETRKDDPAYYGLRGLNPAVVPPLVRAAHARGLRVAAHIETAADFRVIVAAGVDESAHMPGYLGLGEIPRYRITDADARAAARAHIVVVTTAWLGGEDNEKNPARLAQIRDMQRSNLEKLKAAGVPLLIGTDGQPDAAPMEASYLIGLGVLTPAEALDSLTEATPQWIFPGRKIGRLQPGYEASFLVLGADPTADFDHAVADLRRRVKQGFEIPAPAP